MYQHNADQLLANHITASFMHVYKLIFSDLNLLHILYSVGMYVDKSFVFHSSHVSFQVKQLSQPQDEGYRRSIRKKQKVMFNFGKE